MAYINIATQNSDPHGICFSSDGTKMYEGGISGENIYESDLSTAWDLSTATYNSVSINSRWSPTDLYISPDGRKLFQTDTGGK